MGTGDGMFKTAHNMASPAPGFTSPDYNLKGIGYGPKVILNIYTFLNGKYLLDILYNNYLISGGLKVGFTISKILDKGIIELIGPFGLTEGSYAASQSISKLDTGVITTYALFITLGLISILLILFSPILFNINYNGTNEHIISGGSWALPSVWEVSVKILLISIFTTYFVFTDRKDI